MRYLIMSALLLSLAPSLNATVDEEKPKLEVEVKPRRQHKRPSQYSVPVRVNITIRNQDEQWWCAGLHLSCGNGSSSNLPQSCVPFEEASESEKRVKRIRPTPRCQYRYPGEYAITVVIGKGDDIFARKELLVEVY